MSKRRDGVQLHMIEVPTREAAGYVQRHIDLTLPYEPARTLRRIASALTVEGRKLADGRPVRDNATAIEWLLEQVKA